MHGLFITGIDTGVGKTFITCLLARHLRSAGFSVGIYKPACSGAEDGGESRVESPESRANALGSPTSLTETAFSLSQLAGEGGRRPDEGANVPSGDIFYEPSPSPRPSPAEYRLRDGICGAMSRPLPLPAEQLSNFKEMMRGEGWGEGLDQLDSSATLETPHPALTSHLLPSGEKDPIPPPLREGTRVTQKSQTPSRTPECRGEGDALNTLQDSQHSTLSTQPPSWSDIEQLSAALDHRFPREWICPQSFLAPLAPPAAAALEGKSVDSARLRSGIDVWREKVDILLVEGVGGWMSPVTETECVADIARDFGFPVLIVTASRLGMINHTLLTLQSVRFSGLPVCGAVVNLAHSEDDGTNASNPLLLRKLTDVPLFGPLPWGAGSNGELVREIEEVIRHCQRERFLPVRS